MLDVLHFKAPLTLPCLSHTCRLGHNIFKCSVVGRKFKLHTYRYGKVLSVSGVVFLFVFVSKYEVCKTEC